MKKTVQDIRTMLDGLPAYMEVDFQPACMNHECPIHPLRADEIRFFNGDGICSRASTGAKAEIFLAQEVAEHGE